MAGLGGRGVCGCVCVCALAACLLPTCLDRTVALGEGGVLVCGLRGTGGFVCVLAAYSPRGWGRTGALGGGCLGWFVVWVLMGGVWF